MTTRRPHNRAARALRQCRPTVHRDRTKYTRKGRKPRGERGAFAVLAGAEVHASGAL